MAMEKGLYAAPEGLDALDTLMGDMPEIEVEIEDGPEISMNADGSVDVTLEPEDDVAPGGFGANLADELNEGYLQSLSSELMQLVDEDINSRKEWADTYVKGLEVLGFKYEEKTEPWQDACGVYSTVLAEAAIRFQAESMSETFPAAGPVKTAIIGMITKEKEDAAARVREDMNYQLTEKMTEYRPEHERMLYSLGLAGSAFKKVYFDPRLGRQVSVYIPAEDVIVPYGASHIESAERVTHIMRKTENEVARMQAAGFYRDIDLGEPVQFHSDIEKKKAEEGGYSLTQDNRYAIYEVHVDYTLEGVDDEEDDLPKPYVITIDKGTGEILAIRRNWEPEDPLYLKRQHFVHYVYVPGFGFYGLGLIHIIGGYARAGTSIIRQLVDAGSLANLPGGLKSRGLRVKGDDTPIAPGEFRDVDVPSGSIKDNIMTLPYKEPSQTLLALLNQITEEGRRLGAISDMNVSDMSANAPVGTTLALLERTLKPMAAVQSRVHFAMKQEFKLLKAIISDYAPKDYEFDPETSDRKARRSDYSTTEVIPVSDPNSSTMAQRVVQYQAVLQMAQQAPQIYDLPQLHRQMIEVLGVKNADKLVPTTDDQKPRDPVSENMSVLSGKPIRAFIHQDHQAHLAVHQSFLQDPTIAQAIGQNPAAQQMMAAIQAHIAEHTGFLYRKQLEERLGVTLPPPDEELPPEIESTLSQLMAEGAKQLTEQHQQEQAQQQAQQQQQDPLFQLEQQKLQIQQAEVQRKQAKDQADQEYKDKQLQLEMVKAAGSVQNEKARTAASTKQSDDRIKLDMLKAALEAERTKEQQRHQSMEAERNRAAASAKPKPKGKKE